MWLEKHRFFSFRTKSYDVWLRKACLSNDFQDFSRPKQSAVAFNWLVDILSHLNYWNYECLSALLEWHKEIYELSDAKQAPGYRAISSVT
jgi:hypothetical protein